MPRLPQHDDWAGVASSIKAAGDLEVARPEVAAAREMLQHREKVEELAGRLGAASAARDGELLAELLTDARSLGMREERPHCSACWAASGAVEEADSRFAGFSASEKKPIAFSTLVSREANSTVC